MWPFAKQEAPRQLQTKRLYVQKSTDQPESTQLQDNQFAVLYSEGRALEPPLHPLSLMMLSETNEMHAAALDAKAVDAAGRGFKFIAKDNVDDPDLGEWKAITERMKGLSPDYPITELFYQAAFEMDGIGWAGWEVVRDNSNNIAALYPLPAHTLRATLDPSIWVQIRDNRVRYFKRFGIRQGEELNKLTGMWGDAIDQSSRAAEVIIFKQYSGRSSYYSIPKWISALPSMSELTAIREFRTSYFESSGVLDKLIFISSRESVGSAIEEIEGLLLDARNSKHGACVVELPEGAEVQVEELAKSIKEGRGPFRDQRNDLSLSILVAHKVPPYRIGWPVMGSLGGNAAKDMLTAYRYGSVEPLQTNIEHRLYTTLFGPDGFNLQGWQFSFEDLDWSETELSLKLATEATLKGLVSPNEGRRYLGLEPAEDPALDRHYFNGKVLDSSEDTQRTIDIIGDLRDQLENALSEEQEVALDSAQGALVAADQAQAKPQQLTPQGSEQADADRTAEG